jgi:hypothetical protein
MEGSDSRHDYYNIRYMQVYRYAGIYRYACLVHTTEANVNVLDSHILFAASVLVRFCLCVLRCFAPIPPSLRGRAFSDN